MLGELQKDYLILKYQLVNKSNTTVNIRLKLKH